MDMQTILTVIIVVAAFVYTVYSLGKDILTGNSSCCAGVNKKLFKF